MFFLASCKWNQHHLPNPKNPSPSQCQHPAIRRMRRCGISKLRLITKQTRAKSSKGDKCRNKQHRECYKSKWNICNAWPNPVICMCPHIGWGWGLYLCFIHIFYTHLSFLQLNNRGLWKSFERSCQDTNQLCCHGTKARASKKIMAIEK